MILNGKEIMTGGSMIIPIDINVLATIMSITKKGMNITFRKTTAGAPLIAGQDWKPTANTNIDQTVKVVFLPEETINFYTNVRILHTDNDQEGFEYGLMANVGFAPELDDEIIKNGVQYRIRYVLKYAPDDTPILWIIGIKI